MFALMILCECETEMGRTNWATYQPLISLNQNAKQKKNNYCGENGNIQALLQ